MAKPHPAPINKQANVSVETVATVKQVEEQKPQLEKVEEKQAEPVKEEPKVEPQQERPQVTVAQSQTTCESEISKYGWQQDVALAVAKAESGLRPDALNINHITKDHSVGCFQINIYGANARTRPSEAALKNPSTNVAWAWKIYVANGGSFLGQWGVCRAKVSCY